MRWGKKRKVKVAPVGPEPTWYQALAALTMEPRGHTGTKPPQFSYHYLHGQQSRYTVSTSRCSQHLVLDNNIIIPHYVNKCCLPVAKVLQSPVMQLLLLQVLLYNPHSELDTRTNYGHQYKFPQWQLHAGRPAVKAFAQRTLFKMSATP